MSDVINKGFAAMAERIAEATPKETQTNAVIVIIAHSGDQRAVGCSYDSATESPASVKAIIEEAGKEFVLSIPAPSQSSAPDASHCQKIVEALEKQAAELDRVSDYIHECAQDAAIIREAVKLLKQGAEVPDGWQLVPKEPTQEMDDDGWIDKEDVSPSDIYRAMLAAAPKVPG